MTQAVANVLRRVKALIDTPEKWWDGSEKSASEHNLCVGQAIVRIEGCADRGAWLAVRCQIGGADIENWNDAYGRTHADVMAAFDAAIAAEEREP